MVYYINRHQCLRNAHLCYCLMESYKDLVRVFLRKYIVYNKICLIVYKHKF